MTAEAHEATASMGRIGGGWCLSAGLQPGEAVQLAAEVLHKPHTVKTGGRLYLTNERLVYLPGRWSAVLGDERIEAQLEQIEAFGSYRDLSAPVFRDNNLLVYECLYVDAGGQRHLFTTRSAATDREWTAALASATGKQSDSRRREP
jgi:hypothetical protein